MRETEPLDEILELLIRQTKDSILEFKESYVFEGKKDKRLKSNLKDFEKKEKS